MGAFGLGLLGWTVESLATAHARGWTEQALERLEVTWIGEENRAGIPVRDESGDDVGLVRYDPTGTRKPKMLAERGVPRMLFPPPETIADSELGPERTLWLLEGEPDGIRAWSLGIAAVSVPGAQNWRTEWAARFTGRRLRVIVCFDCDATGRENAARAAHDLVAAGIDARLVDLDEREQDGFDLSDWSRGARDEIERGAAVSLLEQLARSAPPYAQNGEISGEISEISGEISEISESVIVVEPLRAFLERELPAAEALVGVTRNGTNLLPRFGWVLPWGREGSGKTSILVDLLFHAASGIPWQRYPVARPLRIVVVINEGIPGGLQDKLAQKLELWEGDREAVLDNVAVYASPWGEFTFQNERIVAHVRDFVTDFGADYVALDPLHTLGTTGAGAPAETEEFKHRLRGFGLWDNLGVISAHHSNKSGMVSGDWARHADTVVRLEKDGKNAATRFTLEKARPADPNELGVPMLLEWVAETIGYRELTLESRELISDDVLVDRVREYLAAQTSPVWITQLKDEVTGDPKRLANVVHAAIARGEIVNESTHPARFRLRLARESDSSSTDGLRQEDRWQQIGMDTGIPSELPPTSHRESTFGHDEVVQWEVEPQAPERGSTYHTDDDNGFDDDDF